MKVDFHTHTTRSDGSHKPETLLYAAEKAGVKILSITDHDVLFPWAELQALQESTSVKLISGIEISAYDDVREQRVHLLAYGFPSQSPRIKALCTATLERRRQFSLRQVAILRRMSFSLQPEQIPASETEAPVVYKQHIMSVLTKAPFGSPEYRSIYRELFKNNGPVSGDITYPNIIEALEAVKADGGLAVIAHPGIFGNFELVEELAPRGLDGIEVWHPEHNAQDIRRACDLAKNYGLLVSGGSDIHGRYGLPLNPGVEPDLSLCDLSPIWSQFV